MKERVSRVIDQWEDASIRRRFEDLYQANYPSIFRYVVRRLEPASKTDDAADITADVFVTAWRRIEKVPAPPDDRLWLYEVARRSLQHHRRSHSRRERLRARLKAEAGVSKSVSSDTTVDDDRIDDDRIRDAIARLGARDREVFALTVWDELDNRSAGRVLGCSANTVAVRLHRARARLREELSGVTRPGTVSDIAPSTPEEKDSWT